MVLVCLTTAGLIEPTPCELLALLYSIIAFFAVSFTVAYFFPNQFLEIIDGEVFYKDELVVLGFGFFAITYILSLMKVLPFTGKRETVHYEISEEDLESDANKDGQDSPLDRGRMDG